jgi:hypothetical protein
MSTNKTPGNGATYLHIEAVDEMIREWQAECADHPALYNQGNVLRDRLAKLQAHIDGPITYVDVTGWGVWAGHAIPIPVAKYIAEKINSLLAGAADPSATAQIDARTQQ